MTIPGGRRRRCNHRDRSGVTGLKDASETLNVTTRLLERGYSKEDIIKVSGGNSLPVLGRSRLIDFHHQSGHSI